MGQITYQQITSLSFRLAPNFWQGWLLQVIEGLDFAQCYPSGMYEVLALVIEEIARADFVGSKKLVSRMAIYQT